MILPIPLNHPASHLISTINYVIYQSTHIENSRGLADTVQSTMVDAFDLVLILTFGSLYCNLALLQSRVYLDCPAGLRGIEARIAPYFAQTHRHDVG